MTDRIERTSHHSYALSTRNVECCIPGMSAECVRAENYTPPADTQVADMLKRQRLQKRLGIPTLDLARYTTEQLVDMVRAGHAPREAEMRRAETVEAMQQNMPSVVRRAETVEAMQQDVPPVSSVPPTPNPTSVPSPVPAAASISIPETGISIADLVAMQRSDATSPLPPRKQRSQPVPSSYDPALLDAWARVVKAWHTCSPVGVTQGAIAAAEAAGMPKVVRLHVGKIPPEGVTLEDCKRTADDLFLLIGTVRAAKKAWQVWLQTVAKDVAQEALTRRDVFGEAAFSEMRHRMNTLQLDRWRDTIARVRLASPSTAATLPLLVRTILNRGHFWPGKESLE